MDHFITTEDRFLLTQTDFTYCYFLFDSISFHKYMRILYTYICHWSLHDPFVEFKKFMTPTVAVETPRDFIFLLFQICIHVVFVQIVTCHFLSRIVFIRCILMMCRCFCVFVFMVTVVRTALVVVVNVDDSHVSSVISSHEVPRIFSSDILWIKLYVDPELRRALLLYFLLYDVLHPMIPIDSSSFWILDSSSILIVRNCLRRLNRPDVFWISSTQIRTSRASSSCRSVPVRTTISSSVFKTSLSNSYSFTRVTFSWSILSSIPCALRSSVSICLSFMSIPHRNYGNLFSTVIQKCFYSLDPVVVSRCVPEHFWIISVAFFYDRFRAGLVRHNILGIWELILTENPLRIFMLKRWGQIGRDTHVTQEKIQNCNSSYSLSR